jgi:hypothetical protein
MYVHLSMLRNVSRRMLYNVVVSASVAWAVGSVNDYYSIFLLHVGGDASSSMRCMSPLCFDTSSCLHHHTTNTKVPHTAAVRQAVRVYYQHCAQLSPIILGAIMLLPLIAHPRPYTSTLCLLTHYPNNVSIPRPILPHCLCHAPQKL